MKGFTAAVFILCLALGGQAEEDNSNLFRITGGVKAKPNTVPSYVALQIFFDRGTKSCGGFLGPAADQVITAASCVFDASEGKANNIKFAFGQSNNFKTNKIPFLDIYRVTAYDAAKNTSGDDLAVIYLASKVKTSSKIAVIVPPVQPLADFYVGQNLLICGFGDIDNFRNQTKSMVCTTLRIVPVAECGATPVPTTICGKNVDGRNVCGGDFGSPAYSNSSGTLEVVGVVSFYPDSKPNARCQGGHYTVLTQLGNFADFIKSPKTLGTNL